MMFSYLSRLSLLWKILLSTSMALTLLFAVTGWIVQDSATRAMSASLEQEVEASFRAYDSLWRARADRLASISLVLSRMSDVRAAFSTGDEATIRDTAGELWSSISNQNAIFVVADPRGRVLASLGGPLPEALRQDMPVVRQASSAFPRQASGFMLASGHLYGIAVTPVYVQAGGGMGLLNVLVAGFAIDGDVVRSLKESTGGSDFTFLAGGAVIASTLAGPANPRVASMPGGQLRRIEADGAEYTMLGTALLDVVGQPVGELRILRSFESARQKIAKLRQDIVLIWLAAMLIGLWLTYLVSRRILEPVRDLDWGATEISRGNYGYRIPTKDAGAGSQDELRRLAEAFNKMCGSIQESRRELIRQERIATIGRLSASIVHDLRNPLAAIYGGAEMLMDSKLSPQQVGRLATNIYRSSRRVQELLQELVDSGRGKSRDPEVCRFKDIVLAAYEVYANVADAQSVQVEIRIADEIELALERAPMERVFLNLIDNALGAMPGGGRLRISAEILGQTVVVRVQDTGPGIAPQIQDQIFQPFVTTGKKNGVGLGLAFSRQTILDHGGDLWTDSETGSGATFFMKLPLSAVQQEADSG